MRLDMVIPADAGWDVYKNPPLPQHSALPLHTFASSASSAFSSLACPAYISYFNRIISSYMGVLLIQLS